MENKTVDQNFQKYTRAGLGQGQGVAQCAAPEQDPGFQSEHRSKARINNKIYEQNA